MDTDFEGLPDHPFLEAESWDDTDSVVRRFRLIARLRHEAEHAMRDDPTLKRRDALFDAVVGAFSHALHFRDTFPGSRRAWTINDVSPQYRPKVQKALDSYTLSTLEPSDPTKLRAEPDTKEWIDARAEAVDDAYRDRTSRLPE